MPALFKRSGGIYYVQFISLSTSFSSSHLQASLGAVDYERGYAVKVYGSGRAGREGFFPRLVLTGDVGWALSIDHSSVWLLGAAGTGFGRTGHVLGNFYFWRIWKQLG